MNEKEVHERIIRLEACRDEVAYRINEVEEELKELIDRRTRITQSVIDATAELEAITKGKQ